MLRLTCPHCGPRDEDEFRWGGDADVTRPDDHAGVEAWAAYLYTRRNPKGANRELWLHWAGCGQWFVLERDSATHGVAPAEGCSGR